MKIIITENQYKLLTEKHSGDIKSYLGERYPNISNLKMRSSKGMKGVVRKYYEPETDKVLFYTNLKLLLPAIFIGQKKLKIYFLLPQLIAPDTEFQEQWFR